MRKLIAKNVMATEIISAHEKMGVLELLELFSREMISGAPVLDGIGRLIGMVSLSDIARSPSQSITDAQKIEPEFYSDTWDKDVEIRELEGFHLNINDRRTVKDVMTHLMMSIHESTPLHKVAENMVRFRVHRLCVTDGEKFLGMITTTDLMKAFSEQRKIQCKVHEIMSKKVITVDEDQPVSEVSQLFANKNISGAPVVDKSGKCVGVISWTDIALHSSKKADIIPAKDTSRFYADTWEYHDMDNTSKVHLKVSDSVPTKSIMNPLVISIPQKASGTDAASLMYRSRVQRLIVKDNEKIVGVLTSTDILSLIAKTS